MMVHFRPPVKGSKQYLPSNPSKALAVLSRKRSCQLGTSQGLTAEYFVFLNPHSTWSATMDWAGGWGGVGLLRERNTVGVPLLKMRNYFPYSKC